MAKPHVLVYTTATVDGKIASITGFSQLSCPHDLRRLHEARAWSDAVMVGANTVLVDDPLLTVRYVEGRNPARIVVDGRLRIPLDARIVVDRSAETIIITSEEAPRGKMDALAGRGATVIVLPGGPRLDMAEVLGTLAGLGYRRILVEGGGELLWSLFEARLVDEVRVTWTPLILGGREAVPMVGGEGFKDKGDAVKLRLVELRRCECGQEIHARYLVEK